MTPKETAKGIVRPSQRAFERMAKEQGFDYVIVRGFDEFKETIEKYIQI